MIATITELTAANRAANAIIAQQADEMAGLQRKLDASEPTLRQCKDALKAIWFTVRLEGTPCQQARLAMAAANKVLDS